MEIYQTEEQQVDAIKNYWAENGKFIIAGLVIGFSGFIGFNLYKDHKAEQQVVVSEKFLSTMETSEKTPAAFNKAGDQFISEFGDTSYASLTALALAKDAATKQDWPSAEKYLTTAVAKASDDGIKGIATLRLARVQVQQAAYDSALTTLSAPLPASFKASVEEIKGDVYLKQGNTELARTAYQASLAAASENGAPNANPLLQMKLDDLAVAVNLSE